MEEIRVEPTLDEERAAMESLKLRDGGQRGLFASMESPLYSKVKLWGLTKPHTGSHVQEQVAQPPWFINMEVSQLCCITRCQWIGMSSLRGRIRRAAKEL